MENLKGEELTIVEALPASVNSLKNTQEQDTTFDNPTIQPTIQPPPPPIPDDPPCQPQVWQLSQHILDLMQGVGVMSNH